MIELVEWARKHAVTPEALRELFSIYEPPTCDPHAKGSEAGVQQHLRVEASRHGARLWRNNTGAFQPTPDEPRWVRYGLGNDSKALNAVWKPSDLIGITPHVVVPEDAGKVLGIFTAVEVKEPSWRGVRDAHERAQAAFLTDVAGRGGIALFATSVSDYTRAIGKC